MFTLVREKDQRKNVAFAIAFAQCKWTFTLDNPDTYIGTDLPLVSTRTQTDVSVSVAVITENPYYIDKSSFCIFDSQT